MENPQAKQWWAPVWKGLVINRDAKHYRRMKNAVWLFLYLVINANRGTGVLMRKIKTISADMGVTRDTIVRWLNTLRKADYIATVNTGRYLTIQIKKWKPVTKAGRMQTQKLSVSDPRSWKSPTPSETPGRRISVHFVPGTGVLTPPNEKKIQKMIINETQHGIAPDAPEPDGRAFKRIGDCAKQELLSWELADALDDLPGINLYRSYCRQYPEWLLRKVLHEVREMPADRSKKGQHEIFIDLIQHYAQGTTTNPGR